MARLKYFFIFVAMALCFPSLSGCGDSKNVKEIKGFLKKLNKTQEKDKLDICMNTPKGYKKFRKDEKDTIVKVWKKIMDICNPVLKKNGKPELDLQFK